MSGPALRLSLTLPFLCSCSRASLQRQTVISAAATVGISARRPVKVRCKRKLGTIDVAGLQRESRATRLSAGAVRIVRRSTLLRFELGETLGTSDSRFLQASVAGVLPLAV